MRIVFMGTPDFAASHLEALLESNYNVVGVFSQPDRPKGRGRKLTPTPVKLVSLKYGIPVFQPDSVNTGDGFDTLCKLSPDVIMTVAYGKLLKKRVIELPSLGCYNVHASLLPRYRGAAPIQRTLENGETETGITIFKIDEGMDSGPIAVAESIEIEMSDSFGTLFEKLQTLGRKMLLNFAASLDNRNPFLTPQSDEEASFAPKILPDDLLLKDFSSATRVFNKIRAFDPAPGVRTSLGGEIVKLFGARPGAEETIGIDGEIVEIDDSGMVVSCGSGSVIISLVQFSGKKKMHPVDALSGRLLGKGMVLGG
ncbi:MAG TPA: methionyl-tRNA formyltransferase [Mesotoga sp.]|jgi:methionyl-tRNA formyltransferase|nr:methionyl-tRNA formyltransferase [Mesotoga sp.]MDI9375140.1 methionyl-tRNA formyltransferase [Thermotogota bacterium]NLX34026.1 methionyl-tRNA formyltransferase [Thermotogaceae bacterium]MDD4479149.1 methionyl-tRNA formyltransferase [Mesotoga sp.]MDD5744212.1 methionyl-tRNA formyltransferase [Mesotoga sp.]